MLKLILSIILLVLCSVGMAQDPSEKQIQDSLEQNDLMDDLLQMMDSFETPESYLKINVGIGNKLFSVHNNSLNALQSNSRIVFTPSLSYYHKSGFGISAAGYLLTSDSKTDFYQYSVTPSYDYLNGETVAAGISYTRYITKDEYAGASSPVQNDFYGYVYLKKPWLQPGLALGYSSGEYKEIATGQFRSPMGIKTFQDTAITKLTSSSLIGTLEHTFDFYSLLSNKDELSVTPTLLLNAGTSKNTVIHKNIYSSQNIQNKKARLKRRQSDNISFQLESLGLSLDLNYNIGKFNFSPQLYLDYYLPKTDYKRFTQVFTFNVGFLF